MSHRSGPEILHYYQQKLGTKLGEVHYHCQNEWVQAHVTWKQYKSLFSTGQERVDLLNKCGSAFFHRVRWYFGEATLLAICRLTDPLRSAGQSNMSLSQYRKHMKTDAQVTKLHALISKAGEAASFARNWRNKRISHNDFSLKVGEGAPLPGYKIDQVDEALCAIHATVAYVALEFMETNLSRDVIDDLANENQMMLRLFLGAQSLKENRKSARGAYPMPGDVPDWVVGR